MAMPSMEGKLVVGARVPLMRGVLLYGAPACGKSALARAVAYGAGATVFDLSPRRVNGLYPGKAVSMLVHLVRCQTSTTYPGPV